MDQQKAKPSPPLSDGDDTDSYKKADDTPQAGEGELKKDGDQSLYRDHGGQTLPRHHSYSLLQSEIHPVHYRRPQTLRHSLEPSGLSNNPLLSWSPVGSSWMEGETDPDPWVMEEPVHHDPNRGLLLDIHQLLPVQQQDMPLHPSVTDPPCPENSARNLQDSTTGEKQKEQAIPNVLTQPNLPHSSFTQWDDPSPYELSFSSRGGTPDHYLSFCNTSSLSQIPSAENRTLTQVDLSDISLDCSADMTADTDSSDSDCGINEQSKLKSAVKLSSRREKHLKKSSPGVASTVDSFKYRLAQPPPGAFRETVIKTLSTAPDATQRHNPDIKSKARAFKRQLTLDSPSFHSYESRIRPDLPLLSSELQQQQNKHIISTHSAHDYVRPQHQQSLEPTDFSCDPWSNLFPNLNQSALTTMPESMALNSTISGSQTSVEGTPHPEKNPWVGRSFRWTGECQKRGLAGQEHSEPGGDGSAQEERFPPVTAGHYSTENPLYFGSPNKLTHLNVSDCSSSVPPSSYSNVRSTYDPSNEMSSRGHFLPGSSSTQRPYVQRSRVHLQCQSRLPPRIPATSPQFPPVIGVNYERKLKSRSSKWKKKTEESFPGVASTADSSDYTLDRPSPGTLRETGLIKTPSTAPDATLGHSQDNTRETDLHATAGSSTLQHFTKDNKDSDSAAFYDREKGDELSGSTVGFHDTLPRRITLDSPSFLSYKSRIRPDLPLLSPELQQQQNKHITSTQSAHDYVRPQHQQSLEPSDFSYDQWSNLFPVYSSRMEGDIVEKMDQTERTPTDHRPHRQYSAWSVPLSSYYSNQSALTTMPGSMALNSTISGSQTSVEGTPHPEKNPWGGRSFRWTGESQKRGLAGQEQSEPGGDGSAQEERFPPVTARKYSAENPLYFDSPDKLTHLNLSDFSSSVPPSSYLNVRSTYDPSNETSGSGHFLPGSSSTQRPYVQRSRVHLPPHSHSFHNYVTFQTPATSPQFPPVIGVKHRRKRKSRSSRWEKKTEESSVEGTPHPDPWVGRSFSWTGESQKRGLAGQEHSGRGGDGSAQEERFPPVTAGHYSTENPLYFDSPDKLTHLNLSDVSSSVLPESNWNVRSSYDSSNEMSGRGHFLPGSSSTQRPLVQRSRRKAKESSHSVASTADSSDYTLDRPSPGPLRETVIKTPSTAADAPPGHSQDNTRAIELQAAAGPSTLQHFMDLVDCPSDSGENIDLVLDVQDTDYHHLYFDNSSYTSAFHTAGSGENFNDKPQPSECEAAGDSDALVKMEAPVTAVKSSVTNTQPTRPHLQLSSDPGRSQRGSSCLPRSHSVPSLSQISSAENKTLRPSESLPDLLLKSSFEEFTPDVTVDENDETYRFLCSCPGLYQCSVTGLVFHMEGEGHVVYRIVSWDRRLLAQHHKKPAGPLFDIKCLQQSVCRLHLPHCEIRSTAGCEFLSVAHVKDESIEFIPPHKITETHVIINITGFSGFGNVKDEDSPPEPVRALVLLFYRPPDDQDLESLLNVLMLPGNTVLRNVRRTRKINVGDELYIETSSHCKLLPKQEYTLSTCPEDDSVLVQPTTAEFDCDNYDNYIPSFQVDLEKILKHIKLFLRDTNRHSVWERRVCLSSAGLKKSCGQSALNLPPNKRLFDVRSSFIEGISGPVLKSLLDKLLEKTVLTDPERESADEMHNKRDKARFVIDTVRKKGDAASSEMIEILCELDPFLCEHLGLV